LLFAVALLLTETLGAQPWPGAQWETADPEDVGLDAALLAEARDYALQGGGSGLIICKGYAVFSWGDQREIVDLKSTTKSIGSTVLALALKDGKVRLDDPARTFHSD